MKEFNLKQKVYISLVIMLIVAIIGVICILTMSMYNGLEALMVIWFIPTFIGLLLCVVSGIVMLFKKPPSDSMKKAMLVGLWFLMVSGGSCGMLWMFAGALSTVY